VTNPSSKDRLGWHSLGASFPCRCGATHSLPIERCHVGADAAAELARHASELGARGCLVVSDANTRAFAEPVVKALHDAGIRVEEKRYGGEPLDATLEEGERVKEAAGDAGLLVAAGAGTLSDLAKYAGGELEVPVLLFPTAASMNGYTSAIVALKVKGLKRTLPCTPAKGIFADPEVAATAPPRMTAAGIADFLSKCSSSTDWRVSHDLRGGYFCERPREFFEGTQEAVLAAAPLVLRAEADAYRAVMEALLLSGFSMVIAGSSAPASGGEHLISHYVDMKSALHGTPHDFHGAQVGVATIYCLQLWERILTLSPDSIDVEACLAAQDAEADIRRAIDDDWDGIAGEVWEQWRRKAMSERGLKEEIETFRSSIETARARWAEDLLPSATVREAILAAGGPVEPEDLAGPIHEYRRAQRFARFIRDRFTVLDLAAELVVEV